MEPTAQCMPPHNHFSAPKWDVSKPRELTQYFKELEYLFKDCGIIDHTQMKEYMARYITYNTAETWTGLPEFAATTTPIGDQAATAISYKNWKEAVIHLYPGAKESMHYMIARRLEILKPTHHPEDPYDVKDIYEAGNWHLKGTDTSLGIPCAKESLPVTTQPQVANNTVTTNSYIKKKDMEAAISAAIALAMTRIETMINTQLSIAALEMELNALKNQVFDGIEVPRPKQPLKSYKPMATIANDPALPVPEAPSAPPSTVPTDNMPTVANTPNFLPPLHLYSGLNNCYQPPAQQNFGAPNKQADGA
ncbi:hypothetical protein C0993_009195 [Termitomyces sp. T159_Od127]|nr:hypothetical protein C0993_009195 [Termitomyces sp. T159_Od127]